jgi:hypothetical protein
MVVGKPVENLLGEDLAARLGGRWSQRTNERVLGLAAAAVG